MSYCNYTTVLLSKYSDQRIFSLHSSLPLNANFIYSSRSTEQIYKFKIYQIFLLTKQN